MGAEVESVTGPAVLVVNPSVMPADTVEKLIAYARSRPGKLNYGSDGVGGSLHLAGELFKMMAKVDIVHVPYKGGSQGAVAASTGEVQMAFSSITSALPMISSGKLRVLAVSSTKRASSLPAIPTLNESALPGYDFSSWQGIVAAAGLPKDIVRRINSVSNKAVDNPQMKETLSKQGREVDIGTPESFGAFLRNEIERNGRLVKFVGLRVELRNLWTIREKDVFERPHQVSIDSIRRKSRSTRSGAKPIGF